MLNFGENFYKSKKISDVIYANAHADDFKGYDPFDGLNSPIFKSLPIISKSSIAQIIWLQFNKRSIFNFRPILGIEKARNPKGVALFISGLIERSSNRNSDEDINQAINLADWLLDERANRGVWKYSAWGYHFDWAARAFYVPKGKPNAITTCYVSRALYQLWQKTGLSRFKEAAIEAGLFLDSLYTASDDAEFYAYIPGERAFVHNASLWTAAVVARTAVELRDQVMVDRTLRVVQRSLDAQHEDGSWAYGTLPHHGFVDGFHTGYNLEAIKLFQNTLGNSCFESSIQKGLNFYKNNFFTSDGDVKYYNSSIWPLDTHSFAQAIITLVRVGGETDDFRLVEKIIGRAIENLYVPSKKRFTYQKKKFINNKINYLRWTQAWAFYALSIYESTIVNNR